ncbi:hypothetical protein ACQUQU_06610 [Thalassolituus sp. LLYu03]|uniref:hypothetical protein n=1 Tax=Thalassolituus sp. LLYu03 TaxID=3421656 RepID=UPI003D2C1FE4
MTRVKKTRSLKRIHSVKTGSISRLKREAREAGGDRQVGKRVKGRRVLSVYEKFLQDNPEAKEKAQSQQAAEVKAEAAKQAKESEKPRRSADKTEEVRPKRDQSLLDILDSKDLKDIY